uniref:Uncharacterized protein n=1 Tax=Kalanchoe fedtschenkoi TaxID=63787 RepID=A0A7N0VLH1_KALFE
MTASNIKIKPGTTKALFNELGLKFSSLELTSNETMKKLIKSPVAAAFSCLMTNDLKLKLGTEKDDMIQLLFDGVVLLNRNGVSGGSSVSSIISFRLQFHFNCYKPSFKLNLGVFLILC